MVSGIHCIFTSSQKKNGVIDEITHFLKVDFKKLVEHLLQWRNTENYKSKAKWRDTENSKNKDRYYPKSLEQDVEQHRAALLPLCSCSNVIVMFPGIYISVKHNKIQGYKDSTDDMLGKNPRIQHACNYYQGIESFKWLVLK